MESQPPSAVTDVVFLQEDLQSPPSNLGILEFLPFEIRLMIYEEYFRSSNPRLDVNVGYEAETGQVVTSKITRRGNELLLAGINIWREGFNFYWRHVTTVKASRTLLQPPEPVPSSSGDDISAPTGQPTEQPLPVHLGCLVQVLPRIAKDSILHLRNIELPTIPGVDPMALGPFALRGPKATALLAQFPKLRTVMFNEYRDGIEYNPQWNLRSRQTIMQHDIHNDFLLHPTMHTPQRWLHDRYGLDVVNDPSVNKIRFLKKAIEKRRSWWEFFPGNAPGGANTDQDLLHPLASPPPLAVCIPSKLHRSKLTLYFLAVDKLSYMTQAKRKAKKRPRRYAPLALKSSLGFPKSPGLFQSEPR